MFRCAKIRVMDLNPHLMCVLCGGYFIDATTVIECLHSFCRTCIVRYLESSKFCPICDVQVHKTRPLLNIRSDKTLQDLVYKLVPGLFEEEMRRRREFHKNLPEDKISNLSLEERGLAHMVSAHRLTDENISVVLELSNSVLRAPDISKRSAIRRKAGDRRYLLCPVEVSIGHLKKFIRLKFSLPQHYQIDVFCSHTDDETLSDDVTLLDISFIHTWSREKPLRLFYSVYVKPRTKRRKKKAQQPDSKKTRTDGLPFSDVTVDLKTKVAVPEVPATVTTPAVEDTIGPAKAAEASQVVKENNSPKPQQESIDSLEAAVKDEGVQKTSVPATTEGSEARPADRPPSSRKSSTDSGSDSRTSFSDSRSSRSRTSSTDSKSTACSSDSRSVTSWSSSSRASSSKAAGTNGSRTNSPRPGGAGGGGSRTASPRPQHALAGPKGTSSPHKAPGGSRTASPKPSSSRTASPKPVNCRNGGGAAVVASLPVGESISVDVSIGAGSSSEVSPDVTSPGAEDRANSGAMAEVPGEFGRGDHLCNVAAAFPAKPAALHDLKTSCAAGQQSQGKGGSGGQGKTSAHAQTKEAAKVPAKAHRHSPARTNGSARR